MCNIYKILLLFLYNQRNVSIMHLIAYLITIFEWLMKDKHFSVTYAVKFNIQSQWTPKQSSAAVHPIWKLHISMTNPPWLLTIMMDTACLLSSFLHCCIESHMSISEPTRLRLNHAYFAGVTICTVIIMKLIQIEKCFLHTFRNHVITQCNLTNSVLFFFKGRVCGWVNAWAFSVLSI